MGLNKKIKAGGGGGAVRVWGDELAGLHYRDNMSMCRKKRCKLLTWIKGKS